MKRCLLCSESFVVRSVCLEDVRFLSIMGWFRVFEAKIGESRLCFNCSFALKHLCSVLPPITSTSSSAALDKMRKRKAFRAVTEEEYLTRQKQKQEREERRRRQNQPKDNA